MITKVLLVAEDDDNDALLIERSLRRADPGFRMVRVENGEELVAYVDGRGRYADRRLYPAPDLVLLDLKMPKMDGFDVLRWRQRAVDAHLLPVVVFSSSTLERDIRKAYELGANSYVIKPMQYEVLDGLVNALLSWWGRFNVTRAPALI